MKKQQRCNIAGAVVFGVLCLVLMEASFRAVMAIGDPWRAVDYWLAWFSGLSLAAAAVCAVSAGVNAAIAMQCEV